MLTMVVANGRVAGVLQFAMVIFLLLSTWSLRREAEEYPDRSQRLGFFGLLGTRG